MSKLETVAKLIAASRSLKAAAETADAERASTINGSAIVMELFDLLDEPTRHRIGRAIKAARHAASVAPAPLNAKASALADELEAWTPIAPVRPAPTAPGSSAIRDAIWRVRYIIAALAAAQAVGVVLVIAIGHR